MNNDEVNIVAADELNSDIETTNENSSSQQQQQQLKHKGICGLLLEPALFLLFFGLNLSGAVLQNQIIFTTCTNTYGYNQSDCAVLGMKEKTDKTHEIEAEVQQYVAKIIMTRQLIEGIIPVIGSLFLGSWSDKNGRKPVLLASFSGYFSGYVILSILVFLSTKYTLSPWLFIMSAIPIALTGGICSVISGLYCYITDVEGSKNQAYRMVLCDSSINLGLMMGSFLSSYLLTATSTMTVFMCSGTAVFFAIIYLIIFIDESVETDNQTKVRDLFDWALVKDMFVTCFERRPNYDRSIIWFTMSSLTIIIFIMNGDGIVFYLFVMEKFDWTIKDYTMYDACNIIISIVGNIVGVFILQKIMKLSIMTLVLLGCGSYVLYSAIAATAIYSWHLYLAISIGFLRGTTSPMCRSIISHIVPPRDIGKIHSFTTSLETITSLLSAPLYAYVYEATLITNPSSFIFISCSLYLLCYIFMSTVFGLQKSSPRETYEAIG